MRSEAIYIIRGTPELHAHATKTVSADFADYLCGPPCISNGEGGRGDWSPEEHALRVKLVFLASLCGMDPPGVDKEFRTTFGDFVRDEAFFDRWWSLERYDWDSSLDHLAERSAPVLARMPRSPNQGVQDWIDSLVEESRKPRP